MGQLFAEEIANGNHPHIDTILQDIASQFNVSVPQYKVGIPQETGVLASFDTESKEISFGSTNPEPKVVAHEMAHHVHNELGHCERAQCENFAYMFEEIYGKSKGLYRHADAECPTGVLNRNRLYYRVAPTLAYSPYLGGAIRLSPLSSIGTAMVGGALIYGLYAYGYKKKSPLSRSNRMTTAGLAMASAVGVGLVLLT